MSAWSRISVTPPIHAAAASSHAAAASSPAHATTGPPASRPKAPTLLMYDKVYTEQALIRQSGECKGGSGIWNIHFKASPARPPLSGEQLAGGEGRLRRWSDDYRALGAIWARTWRRSGWSAGWWAVVIRIAGCWDKPKVEGPSRGPGLGPG